MASVITPAREAVILQERRREALSRLAQTYGSHYTTEPDAITGGHIVRARAVPGRVDIVDATGQCSCQRYRLFDICRHVAIVATREGGRA